MSPPLLEIACFNLPSALIAATGSPSPSLPSHSSSSSSSTTTTTTTSPTIPPTAATADRIEFCASPLLGGTTPLLQDFLSLKNTLSQLQVQNPQQQKKIPINVMIRPRGGSFVYTPDEIEEMKRDLIAFKQAGADGFVFGILREASAPGSSDSKSRDAAEAEGGEQHYEIDIPLNTTLLSLAHPKPCTFHRAFDLLSVSNMPSALESLISIGFTSLLTAGGPNGGAVDNAQMLEQLVKQARGRIDVIPGGGVRGENLGRLREGMGLQEGKEGEEVRWVHSSAIVDTPPPGNGEEERRWVVSREEIGRLKTELRRW